MNGARCPPWLAIDRMRDEPVASPRSMRSPTNSRACADIVVDDRGEGESGSSGSCGLGSTSWARPQAPHTPSRSGSRGCGRSSGCGNRPPAGCAPRSSAGSSTAPHARHGSGPSPRWGCGRSATSDGPVTRNRPSRASRRSCVGLAQSSPLPASWLVGGGRKARAPSSGRRSGPVDIIARGRPRLPGTAPTGGASPGTGGAPGQHRPSRCAAEHPLGTGHSLNVGEGCGEFRLVRCP